VRLAVSLRRKDSSDVFPTYARNIQDVIILTNNIAVFHTLLMGSDLGEVRPDLIFIDFGGLMYRRVGFGGLGVVGERAGDGGGHLWPKVMVQ
jgi:hypothetical protein